MLLRFADRLFNLFLQEPDIFESRFEYMQRICSSMFYFSKENFHDMLSTLLTLFILLFSTYCTFKIFKGLVSVVVKYFFFTLFMALMIFYLDWNKVNASFEWLSSLDWRFLSRPREWAPDLLNDLKETGPIEFFKQMFGF